MDTTNLCTCDDSLAMVSIPKQDWCEPYDYQTALEEGTLFPCLNFPFFKAPIKKCQCSTSNPSAGSSQQSREEMMSQLTAISFALNDLTLYLDTHPDCPNGTKLFYSLSNQRLTLLSQFAAKFYPLTQLSMITGEYDANKYGWVEGPMPWEGACI